MADNQNQSYDFSNAQYYDPTAPTGQGANVNPNGTYTYGQPADQQQYGQQQYGQQPYGQQPYGQPQYYAQPAVNDTGNIGWGILGAFFPIVGLILFLVWKNTKPKTAKVAGIGAIIGFVLGLIMNGCSAIVAASAYGLPLA